MTGDTFAECSEDDVGSGSSAKAETTATHEKKVCNESFISNVGCGVLKVSRCKSWWAWLGFNRESGTSTQVFWTLGRHVLCRRSKFEFGNSNL